MRKLKFKQLAQGPTASMCQKGEIIPRSDSKTCALFSGQGYLPVIVDFYCVPSDGLEAF